MMHRAGGLEVPHSAMPGGSVHCRGNRSPLTNGASAATAGIAPQELAGSPTRTACMSYEQLLSIQQQQHALAMQHKDAELEGLRAVIVAMEAGLSGDERRVASLLRAKDEETALIMASKHKELELMAGLLQLREQQIEDLRRHCEALQELQQRRRQPAAAQCEPASAEMVGTAGFVVEEGSPNSGNSTRAWRAADGQAVGQEVERLRLRMEQMEAALEEQHTRNEGLASALKAKTECVRALEEQVRSMPLRSPGRCRDSSDAVARGLGSGAADSVEAVEATASPQLGTASHFSGDEGDEPTTRKVHLPWTDASQAAETNRQSLELLQEMRRLRMQMGELERLAGTRSAAMNSSRLSCGSGAGRGRAHRNGGYSNNAGEPRPLGQAPAGPTNPPQELQGGRNYTFGGSCPSVAEAGDFLVPGRTIEASSVDDVSEESFLVPQAHAAGARPGLHGVQRGAVRASGSATSLKGAHLDIGYRNGSRSPEEMPSGRAKHLNAQLLGWEYRPHPSDPVDTAVATLLNDPGGRYRGWRALLCRLDWGIYLCGTRRVHLRVDDDEGVIEASDDQGRTWEELEELMRGAEASQRTLLERARDSAGLQT
mmetsp:Transcript_13491/g.29602  ORF Transcript_13491/g.29602 Transcript_13491/m.29602 type:complete len:599 (+) Transcript_13491:58-1854(+)